MTALRRICKELSDINEKPIEGISVDPNEDNYFEWNCILRGAVEGPYKGGTFRFKLTLPPSFPFKAPSVVFQTKIYHPGVNDEGQICVPILRDEWKPSIKLSTVLGVIQEKVNNPSAEDPFEPDIAMLLRNDYAKFLANAKEYTRRYAMSTP